ncbi:DUF3127 domain-containing protein [Flavobacterium psychrophilum]|uniref:DUF3127 domain-containing protein n=1 Tax=Flavobacterium psychrophilum TaxID=96345 RepID=A0A7U2NEG2_FLAPS|nr:DUF3127 domain-containing protein [Flavobacterium psychrophilum]QRE03540.1 DUF3127 domain-containing protein [Flavobacterium psychrophilum]
MEISGKIKVISDDIKVSESFTKRELVITTNEQYPQSILIEFVQDKCDLLDPYKVGEEVKVSINLGGREWVNPQGETKYFNSIKGWRVERLSPAQAPSTQAPANQEKPKEYAPPATEEKHDDLPF